MTLSDRRSRRRGRALAHRSDETLVALVAGGDVAALAALYDRFGGVVYNLASRLAHSTELAEDATLEAFLAVWRSANQYCAARGSARAWILMIAHQGAVARAGRERCGNAAGGTPDRSATAPMSPVVASTSDDARIACERDRVMHAMSHIPNAERESIELAYFDAYTPPELVARFGLPLETFRSQTLTGLRRLGTLLEADAQPTDGVLRAGIRDVDVT